MSTATAPANDIFDILLNRTQQQLGLIQQMRDNARSIQQAFSMMGSVSGVPTAMLQAPKMMQTAPTAAATPSKPGPKSKKPAAKAPAAGSKKRVFDNEKPLKRVVWDILSRPEHTGGGELLGLKTGDIAKIIHAEKLFKTSSKNIGNMIQTQLYKLKEAVCVDRSPEGRYYVIAGATYPQHAEASE
jgi:hypothetical protein